MDGNRRKFNNSLMRTRIYKPLLPATPTNRSECFNNSKAPSHYIQQPHGSCSPSKGKICFDFWRNAVCTRNNCKLIHKPLTWNEPLDTITSYYYYLIRHKVWDASLEIYTIFLTQDEEEKQRTSLRALCFGLIKDGRYGQAFSLQSEVERLQVTDRVILWNFLSVCHLVPHEHKQFAEDFINYLIMTDVKFDPSDVRQTVNNLASMADRRIFWNFLIFALKHDFNPSPIACDLAIEALSTEKFHVNWVLRMFLKSSKEDLWKIKRQNVVYLRLVTKTFCISQNVSKLDDFLKKNGIQLNPECGNGVALVESDSAVSLSGSGHVNSPESENDERLWGQILRNQVITESDFSTLLNRFLRNVEEAPASFESFCSFAKTRKHIEDPSNRSQVRDFYWFSRLGIELMVSCSNQGLFNEAFAILSLMRNLNIDLFSHHNLNKTDLICLIVEICLKTQNERDALHILKDCKDLRREDYFPLMIQSKNDRLPIFTFIINTIDYNNQNH